MVPDLSLRCEREPLDSTHRQPELAGFDVGDAASRKLVFVKEAEGALVPVLLEKYGQEMAAATSSGQGRSTTIRPVPALKRDPGSFDK